jgi:hypothetical protein
MLVTIKQTNTAVVRFIVRFQTRENVGMPMIWHTAVQPNLCVLCG